MTFAVFYEKLTVNQREDLAKAANTSSAYLYQVATGRRNAGLKTIKNLIRADSRIDAAMFGLDISTS